MLNKRTVVLLGLTATIALAGLGVARGAASLMANPTAVAVVDMQVVFDGAKILDQYRAQQQAKAEQLKAEQDSRRKDISAMQYDLEALDAGSDQFKKLQEDLSYKAMEFESWVRFQQAKNQHEQGLQLHKLYRDTRTVVAQVAQEQGYDLVVVQDSTNEITWQQPSELQAQIQLRKVLYASDAIDITQDVITRLNNMHSAG